MGTRNWSDVTRKFPGGAILFAENEPGHRMFIIRQGKIRIYRQVGKEDVELATLGPGDFFGEMALLENLPRSANAQAIEDVDVIEVDAETFEAMLKSNLEIALRMMRKLAARVRDLDFRLQTLLVDNGVGRAIEVLRGLAPKGRPEGDWVRVSASRVHVGIGAQARIPSHQVQYVFDRLRKSGCIREDGKDILIAPSQVLDQFAIYLDLKRRYQPHDQMPVEADSSSDEEKMEVMQRLLKALGIGPDGEAINRDVLTDQYRRYVQLKQQFDVKESTSS